MTFSHSKTKFNLYIHWNFSSKNRKILHWNCRIYLIFKSKTVRYLHKVEFSKMYFYLSRYMNIFESEL